MSSVALYFVYVILLATFVLLATNPDHEVREARQRNSSPLGREKR